MSFRMLKPDDYDDLIALWKRARLSTRPRGRDSREALTRQMAEHPHFFIGAEVNGNLAGSIIASSDGRKGYLNRIAVDPLYRGRGIAQELTCRAEEVLRNTGIKVIELLIEAGNTSSIKLACKMGYIRHDDIIYFSKRESAED